MSDQRRIFEKILTIQAMRQELHEIEQILGRALGYPRFCDDRENFPGTTDADGVATGDHTAVTLAMEAAKLIESVRNTTIIDYVNYKPPGI